MIRVCRVEIPREIEIPFTESRRIGQCFFGSLEEIHGSRIFHSGTVCAAALRPAPRSMSAASIESAAARCFREQLEDLSCVRFKVIVSIIGILELSEGSTCLDRTSSEFGCRSAQTFFSQVSSYSLTLLFLSSGSPRSVFRVFPSFFVPFSMLESMPHSGPSCHLS